MVAGGSADDGAREGKIADDGVFRNGEETHQVRFVLIAVAVHRAPRFRIESVNGEVFFDHLGEVSRIRACLSAYPEDLPCACLRW